MRNTKVKVSRETSHYRELAKKALVCAGMTGLLMASTAPINRVYASGTAVVASSIVDLSGAIVVDTSRAVRPRI